MGCMSPSKLAQSPIPPTHPDIAEMQAEVVEMQRLKEGSLKTNCTGVWIDDDKILTAAHCVKWAIPETCETVNFFGLQGEMCTPSDKPEGQTVYFKPSAEEAALEATIKKYDDNKDLALVEPKNPLSHHSAKLGAKPEVADRVFSVNHSLGLEYSYMEGYVSAIRIDEEDGVKKTQVIGPMTFGASGGPLYNMRGELIGIANAKYKGEQIIFFIHTDMIKDFLK